MEQQQIFKKIFGREEDAPDNAAFLKKITEQYPYFGPAHFFALKHTDPGSENFNEAAAKTSLFFTNPFFLQAQLQPAQIANSINEMEKEAEATPENLPQNYDENRNETVTPVIADEAVNDEEEKKNDTAPVAPVNLPDEMIFEPLHASDYFASQGIKLSEAVAEGDKLGKQLKSFTAWLKTMKKVHPEKIGQADEDTEVAVRNLAEKSNLEREVLTEAMAEAYVQQGKKQKAAEVYSKLSLNYPEKNAYFAAKIESLKQ